MHANPAPTQQQQQQKTRAPAEALHHFQAGRPPGFPVATARIAHDICGVQCRLAFFIACSPRRTRARALAVPFLSTRGLRRRRRRRCGVSAPITPRVHTRTHAGRQAQVSAALHPRRVHLAFIHRRVFVALLLLLLLLRRCASIVFVFL